MGKLSPIESEFDSSEEAEAHERWLRAKVAASLGDGGASIPHEAVMDEVDQAVDEAERRSRVK